jgi:pyridinium-3,5-biscarboxylic acid mononucleotide sulfurtransferase
VTAWLKANSSKQANSPSDRCFHCKTELYSRIAAEQPVLGFDVIANGANADDVGDYRPGMQAAREHGVRSPLIELGLNKVDVRELAKYWQLPVWDKPASPCLSSRIAYGVSVTPERVARVDQAEQFLRDLLSTGELRVRLEANDLARIEVPLGRVTAICEHRDAVAAKLKSLGFRYITLDLEGFRSGSLNAVLPAESLTTAWQSR